MNRDNGIFLDRKVKNMEKELICVLTDEPIKKQKEVISSEIEVKYFYGVDETCNEALEKASVIILAPERFYKLYELEEVVEEKYHKKCICLAKNLSDWHTVKERTGIFHYWIFYDLFAGREYSLNQILDILCPEKPIVSIWKEDLFTILKDEIVVMKCYKDESHIDIKENQKVLLAHVYGETFLSDMGKFYDLTEPEIIAISHLENCKKQYTLLIGKREKYSPISRDNSKSSSDRKSGLTPIFSTALIFIGIVLIYTIFKNYICRGIVLMEGQVHVPSWTMSVMYFLATLMVWLQLENIFLDAFFEMKFIKVLGYALFPSAMCCGYRMMMEGFWILVPVMVLLMLLYIIKRFIKQKKKHKKELVLDSFIRFAKMSIIILSLLFCVKELVVRVIALQCEWTIQAKEFEVEDFAALNYYEDLSFYQKLELSKNTLSNELFVLGIEEPVKLVVDKNYKSEVLAYYNYETGLIDLELKCLEQRDDHQSINTVLHEAFHILQHQWMKKEDELELSSREQEMFNILKNEANDIYIDELVDLNDKYEQYYHSLTEYTARRYADEKVRYYLGRETKEEGCIILAMEYLKWLDQIPKRYT